MSHLAPTKMRVLGLAVFLGLWLGLCMADPSTVYVVDPPCFNTSQSVIKGHFLGTRIPYYSNSTTTFQLRLLISGDVNPNPGPNWFNEHLIDTRNYENLTENQVHQSKITYDRDMLLSFQHNQSRVSFEVWSTIKSLGICSQKPTRRGTAAGRNRHRNNGVDANQPVPDITYPCVNETTQGDHSSKTLTPRTNLPVIFLSNSQSLGNKMDEVNIIFHQEKVDIGVFSESWFNPGMDSRQTNISGYTIFTKSRADRRGGGVAIYVKNGIPSRSLNIEVPADLECTWIEVRPQRLPRGVSAITICVVYIVRDSPLQPMLENHLINTVDHIRTSYPEMGFCIMGDFNRMNINAILRGNNLKQIVTFPTRGNATLDLILTNIQDHYHKPTPYSPIGKSDHDCVLWKPEHKLPDNTKKIRVIRPFGDSCVRALGMWIQDQSWNEVYVSEGSQAKTDALYSILKEGMDLHLPTKRIHIHNSDKPWITPFIKNLISERQTAFAQSDSIKWHKLRNKVKREIEQAKVKYNAERVRDLQKTEPRKWHQRIKCMLNSTVSDLHMNIPGIDSNNHKDMANAINTKFVSVSSHIEPLNISTLPAYLPVDDTPPILHPWEVYKELKAIKSSKASGPDGIPPKLIKEFAYELSKPLTDVLNCSFREGVVPHQWKSAIVVPIPKQYPPSIDKMRPISLTDIFAKIAEGFIAKWVVQDIQDSVDINQFSNIHGVSTAHYLLNLMDVLFQGADKPKNIGTVVLTDFSKAFDLVNHSVAIQKLIALGVRGTIVPWICSFLHGRKQCVRYNQTLSDFLPLFAGVPQGTKLGPIAFQAVINDAAVGGTAHYWKYVDDLTFAENWISSELSNLQGILITYWIGLSLTNSSSIPPNVKPCRFASCVTLLLIHTSEPHVQICQ